MFEWSGATRRTERSGGFDRENGEELGVQVEQCYQENGEEWEYQPGEW